MKVNFPLLILFFSLSIVAVQAQNFKTISGQTISLEQIDQVIEQRMDKLNMAGLSFALIQDGKILNQGHYGFQNWTKGQAIEDHTLFEAASMSKPVFAWLVMKLVEEGKLDLDTPLYKYYHYPDLPYEESVNKITARLVLTHQTGLPNWRYGRDLYFMFEPGTDFSYSGEGFVYLGKTIEHLLGMPLENIFQQYVFQPLGMKQSTMIWSPEVYLTKATGHYNGNVISDDPFRPLSANPASSLLTNTQDFIRFMQAVLKQEGLSAASYAEMFKVQVKPPKGNSHQNEAGSIHWGLGWVLEETPYGFKCQHGGNNGDFESYFELSFDHKSGYVYFSNSDQGDELNAVLKPLLTEGVPADLLDNQLDESFQFDFSSNVWTINDNHKQLNYQDKKALVFPTGGSASLNDRQYKNMIIEFDVAIPAGYTNVGVNFRQADAQNYEQFYIRGHESGTLQSMQYTPIFNDHSGWQLYSGYNYTGLPTYYREGEWMHVRMAIFDDWMEVYIDDMEHLALHVFDLKHAVAPGQLEIWADDFAYFANFRVKEIEDYDFFYDRQPKPTPRKGTITTWSISNNFDSAEFSGEPNPVFLKNLSWKTVDCEYNGLVNLARINPHTYQEDAVLAKVKIIATEDQLRWFQFGYSDACKIYLNGKILYEGQHNFQSRDTQYRGTIGYFDSLYLDLKAGENELWVLVSENFGGWGLMARFDDQPGIKVSP